MQYELASLASHAKTPRSSSGRAILPSGFALANVASIPGCSSNGSAVILQRVRHSVEMRENKTLCSPRSHKSRADCVHSYALWTEFTCHAACELKDAGFCRMIRYIADSGLKAVASTIVYQIQAALSRENCAPQLLQSRRCWRS